MQDDNAGVRLTRSQYREALQKFAERRSSQGFHPNVPKHLSDAPIQATISDRYLGLDFYDWNSVSVAPDTDTWNLRDRLEEVYPGVSTFIVGNWRLGIEQFTSPNDFTVFFRDRFTLQLTGNSPGAVYHSEDLAGVDSTTIHFTLNGGGVLYEGTNLGVSTLGSTSDINTASSFMEVEVKPLPFEIESDPINYELVNLFTL